MTYEELIDLNFKKANVPLEFKKYVWTDSSIDKNEIAIGFSHPPKKIKQAGYSQFHAYRIGKFKNSGFYFTDKGKEVYPHIEQENLKIFVFLEVKNETRIPEIMKANMPIFGFPVGAWLGLRTTFEESLNLQKISITL
jgi:hypothetical protein